MQNKLTIAELVKKKNLTRKIFQVITVQIFPKVKKEQTEISVLEKN